MSQVHPVLLVLMSALLHATWNAGLKREREKDAATLVVVAVAILSGAALALFRRLQGGVAFPDPVALAWTLGSGAFEAGYIWTLARALQAGPLGSTYATARGGSIVVAWPLAILLFDESLHLSSVLAAVLIIAGLFLVGGKGSLSRRALALSLASAACIAGYHLAYKGALATGAEPGAVVSVSLSLAVAANVVMLPASRRAVAWRLIGTRTLPLFAFGMASGLSFLLALFALEQGGAAWVLTLRHVSVAFAALFGWLLGERSTRRQLAGFAAIVLGAALLAAAGSG